MSWSLASRTAAMIDAAITSVEANRSVMRFCSAIAFVRSCSSRAIARLISPIASPPMCDLRWFRQPVVRKQALENVRRQIPTPCPKEWAIGDDPRVWHGLDWCRNVLLTVLADYDKWMDASHRAVEHEISIGEYKANISTNARCLNPGWTPYEPHKPIFSRTLQPTSRIGSLGRSGSS